MRIDVDTFPRQCQHFFFRFIPFRAVNVIRLRNRQCDLHGRDYFFLSSGCLLTDVSRQGKADHHKYGRYLRVSWFPADSGCSHRTAN